MPKAQPGSALEKLLSQKLAHLPERQRAEFIPLSLWGDAVPFKKGVSLFQVFLTCPLEEAGAGRRFLITAFPNDQAVPATFDALWDILLWSLRLAWAGQAPQRRQHWGEQRGPRRHTHRQNPVIPFWGVEGQLLILVFFLNL